MTFLLLLACKEEAKTFDVDLGTIVADRAGESADVSAVSAYGFNDFGHALLYFTGKPDVSCELVTEFLTANDIWDASQVREAGFCEFYVTMSYEGSATHVQDDLLAAYPGLNCAMDDGEWVYETHNTDTDYYYNGPYWQGMPEAFSLDVSGGDSAPFELSLDMDSYSGGFIYDDMTAEPANGAVAGTIQLEWCPDLSNTPLFKNLL